MAVTRETRANKPLVALDVSGQEYLRYRITFSGAQALFDLSDSRTRATILAPPRRSCEWPAPGESVDRGLRTHVLTAQFLPVRSYTYLVTRHAEDGSELETVKDITFVRSKQSDKTFCRLRIAVR